MIWANLGLMGTSGIKRVICPGPRHSGPGTSLGDFWILDFNYCLMLCKEMVSVRGGMHIGWSPDPLPKGTRAPCSPSRVLWMGKGMVHFRSLRPKGSGAARVRLKCGETQPRILVPSTERVLFGYTLDEDLGDIH